MSEKALNLDNVILHSPTLSSLQFRMTNHGTKAKSRTSQVLEDVCSLAAGGGSRPDPWHQIASFLVSIRPQ